MGGSVFSALAKGHIQPLSGRDVARISAITSVAGQRLADTLLQPMTLLAAVVWLFNGSWVDIAIITVVATAASAFGSTAMPYALRYIEDIRLVVLGANVVHAAAAALIVLLGWRIVSYPSSNFVSLLIIAILFWEIGSAVNVTTSPRSPFPGIGDPISGRTRQIAGATAAVIGGLVAWRALGNPDIAFPRSFGWLLALGGMSSIAAVWFQVTAPSRQESPLYRPEVVDMHDIRTTIRIGNVRRFLVFRLFFGLADLADPFLIVYGLIKMPLELRYIGVIVLIMTLAQVAGGIVWTVLRPARGSRRSMQVAAMLRFTGLVLAVGVPVTVNSEAWQGRFGDSALGPLLFVLAFACLGLGQTTYLRNEQPYARRAAADENLYPAAVMLTNGSLLITALAALIGAWVIKVWSLEAALITATAIAFLALMLSGVLTGRRTLRRRALSPALRGPRKPVRGIRRRRPRPRHAK